MCTRPASVSPPNTGPLKDVNGGTISERDSRKDEAVVFMFIFATGGLLAWAACKPWIERYVEVTESPI